MISRQDAAHPPAPRLEAVAAGDEPGPIASHLRVCDACAAYVSRLKEEAEAFRARADAVAFAEAIQRRAATSEGRVRTKVVWLVGPVLAAAAVLLWLRPLARVETVSSFSTPASPNMPSSDIARFKGGLSVAAIRERGGRQERLTGPFEVEPADRIRIEIAVDREKEVMAGLLSDDGTWTLLQAPAELSVGTHYSDLAARFDDAATDALLLVGSPPDVERARSLRDFDHVVAWTVRSAPAR